MRQKKQQANIGDEIEFIREGSFFKGRVCNVRENSVVVEIEKEIAISLGLDTPRTVVNHRKYKITNREANPPAPIRYDIKVWA